MRTGGIAAIARESFEPRQADRPCMSGRPPHSRQPAARVSGCSGSARSMREAAGTPRCEARRDARRPRERRGACGIRCAGIESNGQFRRPQTGQCSSARKATKPHSLQRKLAVRRVSARAVRIARQSSRERMVRLGRTRIAGSGRAPSTRRTFAGRRSVPPRQPIGPCRNAGERTSSTVVRMRCSWILRDIGCAEYVRP